MRCGVGVVVVRVAGLDIFDKAVEVCAGTAIAAITIAAVIMTAEAEKQAASMLPTIARRTAPRSIIYLSSFTYPRPAAAFR
jgi:orotate phosphoribosyltransferase